MKITERDIEILRFINDFGFCEMPQVEKRFGLKRPRSYQIMDRLLKEELVIRKHVLYGRHGVFYLSQRGAEHTELCPVKNIPLGNYDHQIMTIEVYLKLAQQYPEACWISQRYLLRTKFKNVIGRRGHLADGMLIFPDGNKVAIEIELGLKNEKFLKSIIRMYLYDISVNEVWYYCLPKAMTRVRKFAKRIPFAKVYDLDSIIKCEASNN